MHTLKEVWFMKKNSFYLISNLTIAGIALLLFGGVTIAIWYYAIVNISVGAIIAAVLGSLIPALITYALSVSIIEFVKENIIN